MNFTDFSLKKKIILVLTFPMLGLLWLSFNTISQNIKISQEMSTIANLTQLSFVYSELVHELQKERGMTAGFIGSSGKKFGQTLNATILIPRYSSVITILHKMNFRLIR